jgi:hypothetical protein
VGGHVNCSYQFPVMCTTLWSTLASSWANEEYEQNISDKEAWMAVMNWSNVTKMELEESVCETGRWIER